MMLTRCDDSENVLRTTKEKAANVTAFSGRLQRVCSQVEANADDSESDDARDNHDLRLRRVA